MFCGKGALSGYSYQVFRYDGRGFCMFCGKGALSGYSYQVFRYDGRGLSGGCCECMA